MKFGKFEIYLLREGSMLVDGGAAFGPVPRLRWEKRVPPDENHRIPLETRQLLVRGREFNLLIDTGIGNKLDEGRRAIYGIRIFNSIEERLYAFGLAPKDITHVILTHLHNDHSGGATVFSKGRTHLLPAFPNAKYFVQKGEWIEAEVPDETTRVSYSLENYLPLALEGKLELIEGDKEILEGVHTIVTGGHTAFHQMVKIVYGSRSLYFPGDLVPTAFHIPLSWRSAVDLFPRQLMAAKRKLFEEIIGTDNLVVFSHDRDGEFRKISGSMENLIVTEFPEN